MKKKIFFTIIGVAILANVSAQVAVKNNGNLAIGNPSNTGGAVNILVNDRSAIRMTERYPFNYGGIMGSIVYNLTTLSNTVSYQPGTGEVLNFYVEGTGNVWSRGYHTLGSDISFKENIQDIESPLDKVLKLRGVTYQNKLKPTTPFVFREDVVKDGEPETGDAVFKKPTPEVEKQIYAEIEMPRIGFIAQEVEKVIPEVVKTQPDGTKGIVYMELIAMLVEAIKEQQTQIGKQQIQIGEQQEQIKQLAKLMDIKSIDEKIFEESGIKLIPLLLQNVPNPFNQATEIGYYIPETVSKANIYIYDINGFQQRNIPISERGKGATTLQASVLQAGIYYYTLICDGKPVDTKQMILTR